MNKSAMSREEASEKIARGVLNGERAESYARHVQKGPKRVSVLASDDR